MRNSRFLQVFFLVISLPLLIVPVSVANGTGPQNNLFYLPVVFNDFDPTWQFQSPLKVQLQPIPLSSPYLIVDSSGRPHILWDTWPGEKAFIYHTYLTDQGWTIPAPISQTLGRSKLLNPPVAGPHNEIYLVWYNELNFGGPFRILYDAWDGTQWGLEHELLGQGQSIYINGMVRLDNQGNPNVFYMNTDGAFTTHFYFQQWTGTGFSTRQPIDEPTHSSIAWLDTSNGIRFFGDDYYTNSIHYAYWKNGSFLINDQAIHGKMGYRSTFFDGTNNLHLNRAASVPVPGGNVSGLYHQCLKSDLSWTPEKVLTGGENILNYHLAFNNLLQPVIAWSKNDHQTIAVTFWKGCEFASQKEVTLPAILPNGWGEFVAVAENTQAGKVCLLSKEKYATGTLWLTCTQ